jgi:hypothetical protein
VTRERRSRRSFLLALSALACAVWAPGGAVVPVAGAALVASTGLIAPTGLAVADGSIYISNYGTSPASGPGPHGELVRLRFLRS